MNLLNEIYNSEIPKFDSLEAGTVKIQYGIVGLGVLSLTRKIVDPHPMRRIPKNI
jgi:hypothetical protein